jgi:hypothetical protein
MFFVLVTISPHFVALTHNKKDTQEKLCFGNTVTSLKVESALEKGDRGVSRRSRHIRASHPQENF